MADMSASQGIALVDPPTSLARLCGQSADSGATVPPASTGHVLSKGLNVVWMPARKCGAVLDNIAGSPEDTLFVLLAGSLVVLAEDVELVGGKARP